MPEFVSESRRQAYDLLMQAPAGMFGKQLAEAAGVELSAMTKMLNNMRQCGHIDAIPEGTQAHARRVRYYVKCHEQTAKEANRAGLGITWGKGRTSYFARKKAGLDAIGAGQKEYAKRWVSGLIPEPIKCEHKQDNRFTVEKPEPFFSAMALGNYLQTDTWAARAYGK